MTSLVITDHSHSHQPPHLHNHTHNPYTMPSSSFPRPRKWRRERVRGWGVRGGRIVFKVKFMWVVGWWVVCGMERIDVHGQISLLVHLTDAAKMLMLLMRWCCWCNVAADALLLLMRWCCWCADALLLLIHCCCWSADAAELGSGLPRGPFYSILL